MTLQERIPRSYSVVAHHKGLSFLWPGFKSRYEHSSIEFRTLYRDPSCNKLYLLGPMLWRHEESVCCLFFPYDGHHFPVRLLRRRWERHLWIGAFITIAWVSYGLCATHILATGVVLDTNGDLMRASNLPTENRINAGLVGILLSLKSVQLHFFNSRFKITYLAL